MPDGRLGDEPGETAGTGPGAEPPRRAARIESLRRAVEQGDSAAGERALIATRPAEVADAIESLPPELRSRLWRWLAPEARGEVLVEVGSDVRRQLIDEASAVELVAAMQRLQLDEIADLDADLPPAVLEAVVRSMDARRRERYERVRSYPDDTAGGLMDPDAVAVRQDVTLAIVLRYLRLLRHRDGTLPEHLDSIVVVDHADRYVGLLPLADLVSLGEGRTVASALSPVPPIPADLPAQRVARSFADQDLLSSAVVDGDGRLLGRITVDDVVEVIQDEAERSALAPAGLEETDLFAPVAKSAWRRARWLFVHLVNAFVAAWVIARFGGTIQEVVALAFLMPVVASVGGVAGIQTLTLVTRGLALEQVDGGNARRLVAKEVGVALLNGCFWAVVVALVARLWFGDASLAAVFGAALLVNVLAGAVAGTLIPFFTSRLGLDPALAGGVALTATTDVVGFFSFLGLASLVLGPS